MGEGPDDENKNLTFAYDPAKDKLVRHGPRRDTLFGNAASWYVIRFIADNPGVWFMNCQNLWHRLGGMGVTVIVGEEEARRTLKFPKKARELCHRL
jgi:iron transport multicopper oxidase